MISQRVFKEKITQYTALPLALSALAFLYYAFQLWEFGQNQISVLDEGLYLFKGLLFSSGKYAPFQDFGPWTNQMPFAFLIPGWVEQLFGPGLRTGRFFAFIIGIMTFIGLWATSYRFSNRWVAALITIFFALNPATTKIYSVSTSQGLTSFLLIGFLWFTLGKDRKDWQVFAGGVLAGLIVMVRINMLPILPLTLLYVFWEKGWRSTLWSMAGMAIFFGGGHIAYWPEILKIWVKWIPIPFLKEWFPPKTVPTWNPDNPFGFRVASFFLAFRFHFASLLGAIASWFFLSKNKLDQSHSTKVVGFLSILLIIFFFVHVWASLLNDYCVFCFPTYTAFYSILGLLILAITLPSWDLTKSLWGNLTGLAAGIFVVLGITYSAEDSYLTLLGDDFYRDVLNLKVPFLNKTQLWQLVANKFTLDKIDVLRLFHTWLPVVFVLLFLVLVTILMLCSLFFFKRNIRFTISSIFLIILIVGCLLSPTTLFSGYYNAYDCNTNVVDSYEKTGLELSAIIPKDSTVYWAGYSPITLAYLPDVTIFPSQLNGGYSFRISNEDDALLKYGWWNESLAKQWLTQTDFILSQGNNIEKVNKLMDTSTSFDLLFTSEPQTCEPKSQLYLYRRK